MNDDMWPRACAVTRLVASSVRVAERAGSLIKDVMKGGDLKIVNKGTDAKKDLQTEADRCAQLCIVNSLQKQFDNALTIIAEEEIISTKVQVESGHDDHVLTIDDQCSDDIRQIKASDVVIWVDPLDGTSEFTEGTEDSALLQQVTVLIGICYRGRPIAGVVHQPFYANNVGRTIWSIHGCGVHGIEISPMPSTKLIVTTRSHPTPLTEAALSALLSNGLADRVESVGGAGYKVLRCLQDAAAYVYANTGCKKWDTAAPEAILVASGGKMTDISGRLFDYSADAQHINSGGICATAHWIQHDDYVNGVPIEIRHKLPETVDNI